MPLVLMLALLGCRGSLSPLSNKLEVGQEPYIVFVADGEDGLGDLFASPPTGGTAYQVTFTRLDERAPALSPDGSLLAFLRSRTPGDTTALGVVILNLLNGAERRFDPAVTVEALAWSKAGDSLFLRGPTGIHVMPAPPAVPELTAVTTEAGDSLFRVLLGDPPIGEAVPCDSGGVCARLATGTSVLARTGHDPMSWGGDSLLYVESGELVVRPLGGGGTRIIQFGGAVHHPRGVTRFVGVRAR